MEIKQCLACGFDGGTNWKRCRLCEGVALAAEAIDRIARPTVPTRGGLSTEPTTTPSYKRGREGAMTGKDARRFFPEQFSEAVPARPRLKKAPAGAVDLRDVRDVRDEKLRQQAEAAELLLAGQSIAMAREQLRHLERALVEIAAMPLEEEPPKLQAIALREIVAEMARLRVDLDKFVGEYVQGTAELLERLAPPAVGKSERGA